MAPRFLRFPSFPTGPTSAVGGDWLVHGTDTPDLVRRVVSVCELEAGKDTRKMLVFGYGWIDIARVSINAPVDVANI